MDAFRWLAKRRWEDWSTPATLTQPDVPPWEEAGLAEDRAAHEERLRQTAERDAERLAQEAEWEAYKASPEFQRRGERGAETVQRLRRVANQ